MSFLIEDDELIKKHKETWNKVSNSIKRNVLVKQYTKKII